MKVERYQDGQVSTQVPSPAQMGRVDMGAGLQTKAFDSLAKAGATIGGELARAKKEEDALYAREKLIEFQQARQGLEAEFSELRGSDAVSRRGEYVQRLHDLRTSVLASAQDRLQDDPLFKGLDLNIREGVIGGTSHLDAAAVQGRREYDAQTSKDLQKGYLNTAHLDGRALLNMTLYGDRAKAAEDFDAGVSAYTTSTLAVLSKSGLLSEATLESGKKDAESAYALAFLRGALTEGGLESAQDAFAFIQDRGIVLQGKDAEEAKRLLAEKKAATAENDRRAAVAREVSSVLYGNPSYTDLQSRLSEVPDEYRTEVSAAVRAQWNFNQTQKDKAAVASFDEANRLLFENPNLSVMDLAEQRPDLMAGFRDSKALLEKFINRTEVVTDPLYFLPLMAMPKKDLAALYHQKESEKGVGEVNPLVSEFIQKLSETDRKTAMARLEESLTGAKDKSYRNTIEENFGQTLREQTVNYAQRALGFRLEEDTGSVNRQRFQSFVNLANAAFEREFSRMEAAGEPPVISNMTMRKILNEVSLLTPRSDSGLMGLIPNAWRAEEQRELKGVSFLTLEAITPLVSVGVPTRRAFDSYNALQEKYGDQVARQTLEAFAERKATDTSLPFSEKGMDALALSIIKRNKNAK